MPTDDELRERILDAAEQLFADHGYEGTRVRMVADTAGVAPHTVRRLTGGRAELFAQVMAARVTSDAALRIAAAADDPDATPPVPTLVQAADEVFTSPMRSWEVVELEALTRSHRDTELRGIEATRVQDRWANIRSVVEQARESGGLDPDVDPDAVTHLSLALSVGLAMIDPVLAVRPRAEDWNALIARIGVAVAPPEFLLAAGPEPANPWRLRIDIPDRPGGMARLIRALDAMHLYTLGLQVVGTADGYRTIDLAVRAPEGVTAASVLSAAMSTGRTGYLSEGSPEDATDLPTRMLDGAAMLVTNPSLAPRLAAELLEADRVEVTPATVGADDSPDVLRLQWTPDLHVVLHRTWAPFARAEQARASALLRLSAAISALTGQDDALGVVEQIKEGSVWIRLARPEDVDEVAAMHDRSSERTLYLRYVTTRQWRDVQLRRLAGGHRGGTLVALAPDGSIIGLGNVFPETSETDEGAAEIAIIVEDAYQGRGVGTALLRHEIDLARRLGFTEVVGVVLAENAGMIKLLQHAGLDWQSTIDSGVATWRAPLAPPAEAGADPQR